MICLKELNPKNISKSYVKWMNDYNVVKFTEQRFKRHTYKDVKNFVRETSQQNKNIAMKYMQNLTKLCKLYFNN